MIYSNWGLWRNLGQQLPHFIGNLISNLGFLLLNLQLLKAHRLELLSVQRASLSRSSCIFTSFHSYWRHIKTYVKKYAHGINQLESVFFLKFLPQEEVAELFGKWKKRSKKIEKRNLSFWIAQKYTTRYYHCKYAHSAKPVIKSLIPRFRCRCWEHGGWRRWWRSDCEISIFALFTLIV